jgi:hypothetical protein
LNPTEPGLRAGLFHFQEIEMQRHPTPTPMVSVFDGRRCLGWIYRRGRSGFEVFDANEVSLGLFETEREALDALPDAAPREFHNTARATRDEIRTTDAS